MSKFKIACLVLAMLIATTGTVLVVRNLIINDIPDFDVPTEDLNTYLDWSEDIDITDPDADAREFLFVAHKVLLSSEGFYGVARGTSNAMGVTQNVLNTRYVIGEFDNKSVLKEMVTKGLVSNAYQLYLTGGNYIFRNFDKVHALDNVTWQDTAQPLNKDAFYSRFGHRNDKLTGYILNWDTVISGDLYSANDGLYTFHYVLDTNESPKYLIREMITNGNLQSEPTFSKCEIYVTMDKDFNIKFLRTDCMYEAKTMGINAHCSEDITEIFESYEGELPYSDFFADYLDQDGGDIEIEETALDALMNMFSPYLQGEPLQVNLSAIKGGEELVNGLLSIDGLDISDLSKITVSARLGDVDLAYSIADNKMYLQYQDFKGSTTVDGIMELVAMVSALVNGDATTPELDTSALSDIDLEALLEGLTYEISDDGATCAVNWPISIAGLDINANLYADIDGKAYNFTYATIAIDDIVITIAPETWQTADLSGNYPEITGLADLIADGKLALTADVNLPLGDRVYAVSANALVDLATLNLKLDATLGNNGTVNVTLVDNVAYAQFGELKLKLDTTNIDSLMALIERFVDVDTSAMPTISTDMILGALANITATQVTDGVVTLGMSTDDMTVALNLVAVDGRWQVDTIKLNAYGIDATITPSESFDDVTVPTDADAYADVTELVETFADPIMDIINGESYGANFALTLTVDGKRYEVVGSVACDLLGTLKLDATVYHDNVGIINANVVYANDTVYLAVNGIKVAFAVGGNSNSDVDVYGAIAQLLANDDIKTLLDNNQTIADISEQISAMVGAITELKLSDLLDMDLSTIISYFSFTDGVLTISVDGTELGLDGLYLTVTLANDNGNLYVGLSDVEIANVGLSVSATVDVDIDNIDIPDADEYILNLHGELLGAEIDVTADFVHMDIWASVQYGKDTILARYVDGKIYAKYGVIAVVFDTSDIQFVTEKLSSLIDMPQLDEGSLDSLDILAILTAITANLTGETPNITLDIDNVSASVNFVNIDGKLMFDNVSVSFVLNGKQHTATLSQQTEYAEQLDIEQEFVDGQYLDVAQAVNDFADIVADLINAEGYLIGIAGAQITLGSNTYTITGSVRFAHGNVYAKFMLKSNDAYLVRRGELWIVDNILYLQVDDLRLAVSLGENVENSDAPTIDELKDTLNSLKDYNRYLDELIELIQNLLDIDFANIDFETIVSSMSYDRRLAQGQLTLGIDGSQFGLSNFTLTLVSGNDGALTLSLDELGYKDIELNLPYVRVVTYDGEIVAPTEDFTTNVVVEVQQRDGNGERNVIYVNIDLINGVLLARISSTLADADASETYLDIKYTFADNVLKLTNGANLNVSVDINSIADIIYAINDVVNNFADAGDQALPDLFGAMTSDIDIKDIIKSLSIISDGNSAIATLKVLGLDVAAYFRNGLNGITIPVDFIESDLVASFSPSKMDYSPFSDDVTYVSIDQVFNDYYYGEGDKDNPQGAIYNLVNTNSWKFEFTGDAIVSIDGEVYRIGQDPVHNRNSFVAFYYNKTDSSNIQIRANLNLYKYNSTTGSFDEFILLDVVYVDGRIFASYDSNSQDEHGGNVLRATVAVEAIMESIQLLPALGKVIPQIGTMMGGLTGAMDGFEGKLTLGNVSRILQSASYDNGVFTLQVNGQALDANGFDSDDPITLQVSAFGDGLRLDQLTLSYGGVSVNLGGVVVTGSAINEETGKFYYVEDYILGYFAENEKKDGSVLGDETVAENYNENNVYGHDMSNHMNLDSIRELLSALTVTAGNFDEDGGRSFFVDGRLSMEMSLSVLAGVTLNIDLTLYADIDQDGNSYFAVRLYRIYTKASVIGIPISVYADNGGYSYLTYNSSTDEFNLARNSITNITSMWCTMHNQRVTNKSLLTREFSCPVKTGIISTCGTDYLEPYEYSIQSEVGEEQWTVEDISSANFLKYLLTGEDGKPGYLFKLLNFSSTIENIIYEQVTADNDSVYGIEDILKSYSYTVGETDGGEFAITAALKPISDSLGDLNLTIHHSGNFDNVVYDEEGELLDNSGVLLDNISGGLKILGTMIDVKFNLNHTTPDYGIAIGYALNKDYTWIKEIN